MKHVDRKVQKDILKEQQKLNKKRLELYLAVDMHKKMKRTFKGIVSYPQRKILYKIGQKNGS